MRGWYRAGRGLWAVAVVLALAAAGCSGRPAALRIVGVLQSAAANSARDAWAVGRAGAEGCGCGKTLIMHWDGVAWSRVPSPNPGGPIGSLSAVAFTAARDGWAVGAIGDRLLILRWNGARWRPVPSPTPPGGAILNAVAPVSATSAWAVGAVGGFARPRTLILRWDGARWRRVPSPTPPGGGILNAVAAVSATSAWAVGSSRGGALIERWNGRAWKLVRGPASSDLEGVAAVSAASAWAVGYNNGHGDKSLILRLTATGWRRVPSPSPARRCIGAALSGVAATAASAWAVGGYGCGPRTLTLHWDGTAWKQVPSPTPAGSNYLRAVVITPAGGAFAVGSSHGETGSILILHWNGTTWNWPRLH